MGMSNLPVDGLINNETIKFMRHSRCQHSDNDFVASSPWGKYHLRWYFPQRTVDAQKDAEMAFQMWQNVSNLTFTMITNPSRERPDITITMVSKTHYYKTYSMGNDECSSKLGKGVLGHSFFPLSSGTCRKIHLDMDQFFHFGNDAIPEDRISFVMMLVHEIGNTLGIAHMLLQMPLCYCLMYSLYADKIRVLYDDDINAVQYYLYGSKTKYAPIPKFTTMHTLTNILTTTKPTPRSQSIHPQHTTLHTPTTSSTTTRPTTGKQPIHPQHTSRIGAYTNN
ncbi:matrix metalloproteinase-2-like [Diabrotica virgifera virgifera]|uniref:Peptidase metallopeptidase domain-containing protein n=1 Tax=Diabrotica virgifera virgifera TaxID=50390 RepID=A0ABM5L4X3_DIAVI|nr:matrix metalloproteinase-2-like [Diabrotica virgifera virgifera]